MANMTTQEILQGIKDWAAPKVIYDISAAHNNTKYTDLADALGTDGKNIPQEYRKGGITVRYVQSSDNKYVQRRLMADEFTTDTTLWAIADEGVYVDNHEFIEAKTDSEGRLLEARKTDGTKVEYCDLQVEGQIINSSFQEQIDSAVESMQQTITDNFSNIDNIVNNPDNTTPHGYLSEQSNPEWLQVTTDSERRVLGGRKQNGTVVENVGIEVNSVVANKIEFATEAEKDAFVQYLDVQPSQGISTIVVDLPVSDGTDIQSGYAYIDSTDRCVKVKA